MTLATPLEALSRSPVERINEHPFAPGAAGWTVDDLINDPALAHRFYEDRLELSEGVLTQLPPAGFQGVEPTSALRDVLYDEAKATGQMVRFYNETDVMLRRRRVPKPDMVVLTAEQHARQKELERGRELLPDQYRPVFVIPLLIVEAISRGYEDHDRVTKRRWYRLAGVPHYWLLDPKDSSLECLMLEGGRYRRAAFGRGTETIRAPIFGGIDIPLAKVWG